MELLVADQPARATSHDPDFASSGTGPTRSSVTEQPLSRAPSAGRPTSAIPRCASISTPASTAACACAPAARCRSTTSSAWPIAAHGAKIVFDFDDPMGQSTCVACGECVQACPTGALMPAAHARRRTRPAPSSPTARSTRSAPIAASAARSRYHVKDDKIVYVDGRDGPANENRLCVKGRFGFDYIHHPHRLTKPLIRLRRTRRRTPTIRSIRANPLDAFPRGDLGRGAGRRGQRPRKRSATRKGGKALAGFGSAKGSNEEAYLFQKLVRTGFGTNNVDHCTRLCHASSVAALMEGVNSGAVTRPSRPRMDAELHHRHRRQPDREPPGRRDLHQARGQARRQADRDGSARPGADRATPDASAVQARQRRRDAERHAAHHHRRKA